MTKTVNIIKDKDLIFIPASFYMVNDAKVLRLMRVNKYLIIQ